ncbi:uncharacterized protein GGS22DRAFT_186182 [Annulohypoxylon maeteangense]|uniref:uncharacterized protein n=1 Tax=Annulohypoxylon maeteangense TaxID=1927788 RepID=UPI002007A7D7|nr:uncharacterized protein GGS22DRAFT_186182 [Annulohypoxylon maeteangense]KAI0887350.1 hypothetical protein GGS22DRAFT_186182 [Annulohypoxylon maeteangense]
MSRKLALGASRASNGAFTFAARTAMSTTQRTFSSTAQRNREMIYFSKASSEELDNILSEIRHQIILPAFLPQDQRKKIYSKKYEKQLQADPITIEIDGEVFKFRHQSPFSSVPNTKKALYRAIELFSTPEDFSNLRPLIEGLAIADRTFNVNSQTKLTRLIGDKGRIYDIIELARSVKRTSFKLDMSEKVTEILYHVQMRAVRSGWDLEETRKALRWTEIVVALLEEKDHQPANGLVPRDTLPLARDPMVLLSPLHLAAVLVQKQGTEAEPAVVDKVIQYATKIVLLWDEGKTLRQTQPESLFQPDEPLAYIAVDNKFVKLGASWLYGLNAALEVLQNQGPQHAELAAKLKTRRDSLEEELRLARENAKGGVGEAVWQVVFGGMGPVGDVDQEIRDSIDRKTG